MKGVILVHQLSCFAGVGQTVQVEPIKCSRNILVCGRMFRVLLEQGEQGLLYLRIRVRGALRC